MDTGSRCVECGHENRHAQHEASVRCSSCSAIYSYADRGKETVSMCVRCRARNPHRVGADGEATIVCGSCSAKYDVKSYTVRRRSKHVKSNLAYYRVAAWRPDSRETVLAFSVREDVDITPYDQITGSVDHKGQLRYVLNNTKDVYIDVQRDSSAGGCGGLVALAVLCVASAALVAWGI